MPTKTYRAELSDFGWAVTWDGESEREFKARQASRFCAGAPVHANADDALDYWSRRYLKGEPINTQSQAV